MFCPRCGKEVGDADKCWSCGSVISRESFSSNIDLVESDFDEVLTDYDHTENIPVDDQTELILDEPVATPSIIEPAQPDPDLNPSPQTPQYSADVPVQQGIEAAQQPQHQVQAAPQAQTPVLAQQPSASQAGTQSQFDATAPLPQPPSSQQSQQQQPLPSNVQPGQQVPAPPAQNQIQHVSPETHPSPSASQPPTQPQHPAPSVQQPQQVGIPDPAQQSPPAVPHHPSSPPPHTVQPQQQNAPSPAQPHQPSIFDQPSSVPGGPIEVAKPQGEMELVGAGEFEPPEDLPQPGFGGAPSSVSPEPAASPFLQQNAADSETIPPAFARSMEDDGILPKAADHFGAPSESVPRRPVTPRGELHGNEMVYKIATIAMTVVSFFTLGMMTTIEQGIFNPYDSLSIGRVLVFAALLLFTIIVFFKGSMSGKEQTYKTITIVLAILVGLGSFVGRSGIGTSKTSNFLVANIPGKTFLVDRGSLYARNPSISPDGKQAVVNLYSLNQPTAFVTLIGTTAQEDRKETTIVTSDINSKNPVYWTDDYGIIYSPKDSFYGQVFKFNTYSCSDYKAIFDTEADSSGCYNYTVFSSQFFNLIYDYDYHPRKNILVSSFHNLLWLCDFEVGRVLPLTGLSLLGESDYFHSVVGTSSFDQYAKSVLERNSRKPYIDTKPRFQSDGKKVFFIRSDPDKPQENDLYMLDLSKISLEKMKDSESLSKVIEDSTTQLTSDVYRYKSLAVSPNGRFLATWVEANESNGAKMNEMALVFYDIKEKTHIRIFPDYLTEASVEHVDWSRDGTFLLIEMDSGLRSSIIRIDVPNAIVKLDQKYALDY